MAYLETDNTWVAQSTAGDAVNGGPDWGGRPGYRGFGKICVYVPTIDRTLAINGSEGTYMSDVWQLHEDRVWKRKRPDNANGIPASPSNRQDVFGPARGDNRHLVYIPVDSLSHPGMVWEWGGNDTASTTGVEAQDAAWQSLVNVHEYDPVANTWTELTTTGFDRYLAGGCGWDPNINKVLGFMGERGASSFSIVGSQRVFEIDPTTVTMTQYPWSTGAGPDGRTNIPNQVVYHTLAKKWILFGGGTSPGSGNIYYNDTWTYDAVTRVWANMNPPNSPPARALALMVYDEANNITHLFGGATNNAGPAIQDHWVYSLEYNQWKQLADPPMARFQGGVVYDTTRKLIVSPFGGSGDQDTWVYKYAIPRVTIASRSWVAMPVPDRDHGIRDSGGFKHVTSVYWPEGRLILQHGGDFTAPAESDGTGNFGGSYRQWVGSIHLGNRFAGPTDRNAGSTWFDGPCASGANGVRPKHPDYIPLLWDSRRKLFWMIPGLMENVGGVEAAIYNCVDETALAQSDPKYIWRRVMSFDPVTKAWLDRAPHGLQTPSDPAPWLSIYDAQKDRIYRIEESLFQTFDPNTLTWAETSITGAPSSDLQRSYPGGWDPQRRQWYGVSRIAGKLWRVNVDAASKSFEVLGDLPGVPIYTGGIPGDRGFCVFNWNQRILYYSELRVGFLSRAWALPVDVTPWVWVDITSDPIVALNPAIPPTGTDLTPVGHSLVFDPDNNVVGMFGPYTGEASHNFNWVHCWAQMGESSVTSVTPLQFTYRRV